MKLRRQQIEITFDRRCDVGRREGVDPASRQLNRQRHPIDQTADARHRIQLLQDEIEEFYGRFRVTNDLIELRNLVLTAELIVRESSGPAKKR